MSSKSYDECLIGLSLHDIRESISEVTVRQQILRIRRVVFELLAQLIDKGAQIFQLAPELRTPHGAQQLRVRNRFPGVSHQVLQKIELLGGEMNRSLLLAHLAALGIHLNLADP